jgi:glycosyltransferase involved in cell wall biosynthesis
MPKVSVIMSVFNNEKTLEAAIQSILAQTYTDFEFIIVDDACTDDSSRIVNLFAATDKRITVIKNQKNEGLGFSLNKALEKARGEFIARQDGHGRSMPHRLEHQVSFLQSHKEVSVLGTAALLEDRGEPAGEYIPPQEDIHIKNLLRHKNIMVHGSIMARAEAFKKAGGYNPSYRYVQDYELWLRLAASGAVFANLREPLYVLDQTPKSVKVNAQKLVCLMNVKQGNKTPLPLSKLPLLRRAQFYRYQLRYYVKRFLGF